MSIREVDAMHTTRRFNASPEQVFEAWVNPDILRLWLAPMVEADARVGGRFRLEVSNPEGVHLVTGVYRELVPGQHIVMTWVYAGPMGSAEQMEALLTIDFHKRGSNTEIELHHNHLTNPVYRDTIQRGAWTRAFDELEKILPSSSVSGGSIQ
jgi:uncharacterized protein YndB with AHSA1/START domain